MPSKKSEGDPAKARGRDAAGWLLIRKAEARLHHYLFTSNPLVMQSKGCSLALTLAHILSPVSGHLATVSLIMTFFIQGHKEKVNQWYLYNLKTLVCFVDFAKGLGLHAFQIKTADKVSCHWRHLLNEWQLYLLHFPILNKMILYSYWRTTEHVN